MVDFHCIKECSQCCIEREYYPSKKFGKIGVLILPEEKKNIENLARNLGLKINILPRIGVSSKKSDLPTKILAYQLMGIEQNGNMCPFLDTESQKRSPHGGFSCKIYEKRPLACKAYPLVETNPVALDSKCKFCQTHGQTSQNLSSELEALDTIKKEMGDEGKVIWRYATGIGDDHDKHEIESGWILEH